MGPLEWGSLSSSGKHTDSWGVIEQAKEELQMLETQHPNRFNYLKDELKIFIFAESQKLLQLQNNIIFSTSSTATTQASTSRHMKRKRKMGDCSSEKASKHKLQSWEDRVEAVLERAQVCLTKIRDFKTSYMVALDKA